MYSLIRLMCAVTLLAVAGTSTPTLASDADYDHLKCFKIRDSLVERRTIYLADIFPNAPFAMQKDCRLRLPAAHFCVNVAKENVRVGDEPLDTLPFVGDPARDYLCYGLKCDRDRMELPALDQFGARTLRTRKSDFLCMPANKILPSPEPTPTETPTVTPTPQPQGCDIIIDAQGDANVGGFCGGDCPSGETCVAVSGPAARGPEICDCVPDELTCGERPIGTGQPDPNGICGGFCPSPYAVCTGDLARGPGFCQCEVF